MHSFIFKSMDDQFSAGFDLNVESLAKSVVRL